MMRKQCNKCNEMKPVSRFNKDKSHVDGYKNQCKSCVSEAKKEYYQQKKEEKRKYYLKNKNKIIEAAKKRHKENYEKSTGEVRLCGCCGDMYWCEPKSKAQKKYCGKVCKEIKRKELRRKRENKKAKEDPVFRLDRNMRFAIWKALKNNKQGESWKRLVGYSLEDLKEHLESQFKDGMTWYNYGEWHVDHIIPKSLFNYKSVDDLGFIECWSLKNLQPLWAEENLEKRDSYEGQLKIYMG